MRPSPSNLQKWCHQKARRGLMRECRNFIGPADAATVNRTASSLGDLVSTLSCESRVSLPVPLASSLHDDARANDHWQECAAHPNSMYHFRSFFSLRQDISRTSAFTPSRRIAARRAAHEHVTKTYLVAGVPRACPDLSTIVVGEATAPGEPGIGW